MLRKDYTKFLKIENQLAFDLSSCNNLQNALKKCLETAIEISTMDSGGIYLFNPESSALELQYHTGLGEEFIDVTTSFPQDSQIAQLVLRGESVHRPYISFVREIHTEPDRIREREGLRFISSVAIKTGDTVIGCLNVASHTKKDIPQYNLLSLEHLALHVGAVLERLQLQDHNQQKQQQLNRFFESLADFIFIVGMDGVILDANQIVTDRLGYSPQELVGRNVLEMHPPDRRDDARQVLHKMMEEGVTECPIELISKTGERIAVSTKVSLSTWNDEPAIIGISRDISAQQRLEEIQQQNLGFFEFLVIMSTELIKAPVEEVDVIIMTILEKIGLFDLSDRSYVFLFPDEDTLSNTHEWCAEGIRPEIDNLQNLPKSMFPVSLTALEETGIFNVEDVAALPEREGDETKAILLAQSIQSILLVPLIAQPNTLIGFVGFDSVKKKRSYSDNSIYLIRLAADMIANALQRKEQEETLRSSEAKNAGIIHSFPDPLLFLDREGRLLECHYTGNEYPFTHLKPASRDERLLISLLPPDQQATRDRLIEVLMRAIDQRTTESALFEYKQLQGNSFWFEARITGMESNRAICTLRNITDRINMEREKIDFMNLAAHELRSPISTMRLMTELINLPQEDPEQVMFWNILREELNRQYLLVENILSGNKLEDGRFVFDFRRYPLENAGQRLCGDIQQFADQNQIDLQTTAALPATPAFIKLDLASIGLALTNLLDNAKKYSRGESHVQIRMKIEEDWLKIFVQDNGVGIHPEDLPHIFERYRRGQNTRGNEVKGTGLGLFIVRSIVESHGGTVAVRSELGTGTTFEMKFPLITTQ